MRVFVTGASGHIRLALVQELLAAGHEVVGLARSDASATAVAAAGAQVHRGDLDDSAGLQDAASGADAHTQQLLNWHPSGPSMLEDLDSGHYFTHSGARQRLTDA